MLTIAADDPLAPVREFLRALSSSIRAWALYPFEHPIREEHIEDMVRTAHQVQQLFPRYEYFVYEDSLFFGERLLTKESLTFQWLIRDWQAREIHSLTIESPIHRMQLMQLVDFLSDQGPMPTKSISINASELTPAQREAQKPGQLRTAYADALDLMREVGEGVAKGVSPPLGMAQDTVEGLVDAVLRDPASALLLSTIRAHDEYTFFHMVNVCILSIATGASIGLNKKMLASLGLGALLHDMGKVAVPADVLNRSGVLAPEEWDQIRKHPVEGAAVILQSWDRVSPLAAIVAYEHHLRMDGTGYPLNRLDEKTNILSRIVSVADTFDAITSRRSYRRAEQRERALDILLSGAGPHYDPRIVKVFIRMMGFYPPGSVVRLDDDAIAVVIRNNPDALSNPVVKVVRDSSGERVEPYELDLDVSEAHGKLRKIIQGLDPNEAGVEPSDLA